MRYFTSDLHIGHTNIIDFSNRPFKDVDHMNTELVRRWNETVSEDDEVWVVGDLAMGQIDHSLEVASRLQGHKRLLPGNHDRCWRGGKKDWEDWIPRYEAAGFTVDGTDDVIRIAGQQVYVCHFPPSAPTGFTDRFSAHRPPPDWPYWIIHGHVHDAWARRDKWINVGVDVWGYSPVSEDTLEKIISALT